MLPDFFGSMSSWWNPTGSSGSERVNRIATDRERALYDQVLASPDREALRKRIDILITSDDWNALVWCGRRAESPPVTEINAASVPERLDEASLERAIGATATRACANGHEVFRTFVREIGAVLPVLSTAGQKDSTPTATAAPQSMLDIMYNTEMPRAFRRWIRLIVTAVAAQNTIARAEELDEPLSPWLALALAETYRDSWVEVHRNFRTVLRGPADAIVESLATARERGNLYRSIIDTAGAEL